MQPKTKTHKPMKFNEKQKTALAKTLSDLVQCDGIVNQGEIEFLKKVYAVFGITSTSRKKATSLSLSEAVETLKTLGQLEKNILLRLLQQLSLSDDSLDPNESLLITALILSIGIELPETQEIKAHLVSIPNLNFDTRDAVLYVEAEYDKRVNANMLNDYEAVCRLLRLSRRDFFYLPKVMDELQDIKTTLKDTLNYIEPTLSDEQLELIDRELYRLDSVALSKEIFLNYLNTNGIQLNHPAFFFKIGDQHNGTYQDFLILEIPEKPLITLERFYQLNANITQIETKTLSVKEERLLSSLTLNPSEKQKEELRYTGFHKILIDILLKHNGPHNVSRLFITKRGDLFLTDRNNTEVKMATLSKALYILFLFHEEGIPLACLSDYKPELYRIYRRISNYGDDAILSRAIDNLTDFVGPTLNSTLSRIKKAFTDILGDEAVFYVIQGEKGGRKTIHLDRRLVVFEDKKAFE